jgi:ketosteroid isomerase-like protein
MSQGNVKVVREAWDAWLGGDMETLFGSYFGPDAVYDLSHFRQWPDQTYRGLDGIRRGLSEWREVWVAWEARVDDILPAPDGRVVVLTWQRGQGRESGLPMDFEWAQIITLEDGKITRVDAYDDRAEALEAAGLSG